MAMDVDAGQHDISTADLSTADLSTADLSTADLSTADISTADLSTADLSTADLSDGNLSDARAHDLSPTGTDWRDVALPEASPGRRRNVAQRRAMGGDLSCVPPDFNDSMLAIWEQLWQSMPQSGKISVTVNYLLEKYKEHCRAERKRRHESGEAPPALLPVSFGQAKDWLIKQQRAHSQAVEIGAVNEEARAVVNELDQSLAEQTASTVRLLSQPACAATPVIPQPVMSLGPDPVTDRVRAVEHAEERSRRQIEKNQVRAGEHSAGPSQKVAPAKKAAPKKKTIQPELKERRERAAEVMLQLGVAPVQDSSRGKRRCPVCDQYRTASDRTPNGEIHRVLGRSNQVWCPYADDKSILDKFEEEQKERKQASWRKANEAKRLKKQSMATF